MCTPVYRALENPDASWHCDHCGMPNFSSGLFESTEASTSNLFDSLSSIQSTPSTPENPGPPRFQSSPKQNSNGSNKLTHKITNNTEVIVINFQSIKNKKEEFWALIDQLDPDIVIGTETWLSPTINDTEVAPKGYKAYRKDRQEDPHGGVIIFTKTNIVCEEIQVDDQETIFIKMRQQDDTPLIVGAIYRPPSSSYEHLDSVCNTVHDIALKHKKATIWLGGDFNLPDISWENHQITGHQYPLRFNNRLLEEVQDLGLEQVADFPTRNEAFLDLLLTNRPSLVNKCVPLPGLSDHDTIIHANCDVAARKQKPTKRKIFLWSKADTTALNDGTRSFSDSFTSKHDASSDVEDMWNEFKSGVNNIIDTHIPSKMSTSRFNQAWINRKVKRLCRQKNRSYRKAKTTNKAADWRRYQHLKRACRNLCRETYNNYIRDIISPDLGSNPKKFWSFVKSKRTDSSGVAPLKNKDGLIYSDSTTKANILNDQFSSVFNKNEDVSSIPSKGPSPHREMPHIMVSTEGVIKLLKGLNPHKATGPDCIPARFLKETAESIAPSLATLFQASIDQGVTPSDWGKANVVPLFKKGDKSKASNYRPVSLTSICCKVLEHIVHSAIMNHFEELNLLTDYQHGFRKKRSCESQLIITLQDLASSLSNSEQVDVILLDFSKAFDKVAHQRLLYKLDYYGVRGPVNQWIRNFLGGRTQIVTLDGTTSRPADVQSGVPQGTVLGPLLFLAYINDLPECITSGTHARLFADDCVLYRTIKSESDAQVLQKDLDQLQQWEADWLMEFHPEKCQLLRVTNKRKPIGATYSIHQHALEQTETAKYLGVTLHEKLSWNSHIHTITKKANNTTAFLQRNLNHAPKEIKARCYLTLVRPTLEYASSVWSPHTDKNIKKLEASQRRAARYVHQDYRRTSSVTSMVKDLQWQPLQQRRNQARAVMMYRIVHNLVAVPSTMLHHTTSLARGHAARFLIPYARTEVYKNSFFPATIRIWNALPAAVVEVDTIEAFKTAVLTC
jgi:hypothetical protein